MMGIFKQPRSAGDAIGAYCAAANELAHLRVDCAVMYGNPGAGEARCQALKQDPMLLPAAGRGPPRATEVGR